MFARFKSDSLSKWGVALLLAAVLVTLALASYQIIERSRSDIERLSAVDLPVLNDVQALRIALASMESAVYEYYLTAEVERFQARYSQQRNKAHRSLASLDRALGDRDELETLRNISVSAQHTADVFAAVMQSEKIDWNEAREALAAFGPLTLAANRESERIGSFMRERMLLHAADYNTRMQISVGLAAVLAALAVFVAAWLARTNYSHLRSLHEQQRLSSFPRSTPHPVLALDRQGAVIYANEATYVVSCGETPLSLFPADFKSYLVEAQGYQEWEFSKGGRHFYISLGWHAEYQEYHVYLSEITARKKAEEDLEYLAYHDPITGLVNRQQFNDIVDQHLLGENSGSVVAILDLGLLEDVIVAAGVNVMEKVARIAAMRMQHRLTEDTSLKESCLSYIGGGLFCLAFRCDRLDACPTLVMIRESLARPIHIEGFEFTLSLTVGLVTQEYLDSANCEEALRLADGALNLAQRRGGNQTVVYEEDIEHEHQRRLSIEAGLRGAIEKEELTLFYQPKFTLENNAINGVEALLRWRHSELGEVSPAEFIPIAEHSGQIIELGRWVLDRACRDVAEWNRSGDGFVHVAINISAHQLLHSDIGAEVLAATERYDVPLNWLELEITETAALHDFDRALDVLHQLAALHIHLTLDDFGTGYSSLSYLQRMPIKTLKIDRTFIHEIDSEEKSARLSEAIINMAHEMGLKVVAEGVERDLQLVLLKRWRCEVAQGFYLAMPMAYDELLSLLRHPKGAEVSTMC